MMTVWHILRRACRIHRIITRSDDSIFAKNSHETMNLSSDGIVVLPESKNVIIWQNVFQEDSTIDDPKYYRGANMISFSPSFPFGFGAKMTHFVIKENLFTYVWTPIGMHPTETSDILIEGNWFTNVYLGIAIDYSDVDDPIPILEPRPKDIRILYNAFINITTVPEIRVYFSAREVTVDDGSRGNYWGRHARSQDDSDGDGIIDVPYVIFDNTSSNDSRDDVVDLHPLAEPIPIPWFDGYPAPWNDIVKPYLPSDAILPSNDGMQNQETRTNDEGVVRLELDRWSLIASFLAIIIGCMVHSYHEGKRKKQTLGNG